MNTEVKKDAAPDAMIHCTTQIVSAYVGRNHVAATELPTLIATVYRAFAMATGEGAGDIAPAQHRDQRPAVPIKKSITPDHIVCLEDGKKLKMLKRYLRSHYDMSPEQYRAKWGLPPEYPMSAPNYSKQRSDFAKSIGLGRTASAPPLKAKRAPRPAATHEARAT
jgi:predicted transcriptional regulator